MSSEVYKMCSYLGLLSLSAPLLEKLDPGWLWPCAVGRCSGCSPVMVIQRVLGLVVRSQCLDGHWMGGWGGG
jgi:hypothetical protein